MGDVAQKTPKLSSLSTLLTSFIPMLRLPWSLVIATTRSLWPWAWAVVAMLVWGTGIVLRPVEAVGGQPDQAGTAYELAFIGALVGCFLGLGQLQRTRALVANLPPRHETVLALITLVGHSVALTALALVPGLALGLWRPDSFGLLVLPAVLLHVSLVACALHCLQNRLLPGRAGSGVTLVLLVWILPALLGPLGATGSWLASSLAPAPLAHRVLEGDGWEPLIAPIIGWFALVFLLLEGRRAPQHAVRDPR